MERNLRLDYFRIILSILVITIHAQPLFSERSLTGWLISNGIARIAVPCFFIMSGYFIHSKLNNKKDLKRYLLRILVIYILWSLIYLLTYYHTIETRSLITFAFMGYYRLWFLPALFIGILLLVGIRKVVKEDKMILVSGIILFFIGTIMESYFKLPYRTYCNGIFFGYPFVALGYVIQKRNWKDNYNTILLYSLLVISFVLLIIQSYIGYIQEIYYNMSIALYIFCPMLFTLILRGSKELPSKGYIHKVASNIYYIHIFVLTMIIPLSDTDNIYKLPLITIISVLLSIFIVIINKRIKIFL